MKEGIHPGYKSSRIVCACGNVIETQSTRGDYHVDICAACHPFFTGKQKLMDTAGRIEKFKTRYQGGPAAGEAPKKKEEPRPAVSAKPAKKIETRAQRRARENAGKPKAEAKVEAKPEKPEEGAAAEPEAKA